MNKKRVDWSQLAQLKSQLPPGEEGDAASEEEIEQISAFQEGFHNPYNFIPAPSRKQTGELQDEKPSGHASYLKNKWSGRIRVALETITPLLIPDAANLKEIGREKHKSYPIRKLGELPYLPPTSIKGMLRTAYEAVTNSRFGVFQNHEDRLAYRMPATEGLSLVPARIEGNCDRIQLLPGTTPGLPTLNTGNERWNIPGNLMYAAWLPRYKKGSDCLLDKPELIGMQHGQTVKVWLQKVKRRPFFYWVVCDIVPSSSALPERPTPPTNLSRSHKLTSETLRIENAYLCITNQNIENKYNERVFFTRPADEKKWSVSLNELQADELRKAWKELIENYQEEHEREIEAGSERPPQTSYGKWSRHITGGSQEAQLKDGTLCYAFVEKDGQSFKVIALYPVMIARKLFEVDPDSLLPESLKPPGSFNELSPADRVFGWVNQKGKGAYKGQLRLHSVKCLSTDAIQKFTDDPANNPGLPLTILGQPKPQQSRFYVAKDKQGDALSNGTPKQDGYASAKQGLRGRKVYPHHKAIAKNADYWNDPMSDRSHISHDGYHQEYRRPNKDSTEQRDSQNRSIQAWVRQNTQFQFDIDITNLSSVELGALLWLLTLPDDHYHRLGGGKPLGFGSVQLKIDWSQTDLRLGQAWKQYYESLLPIEPPDPGQAAECIDAFKQAVALAYSPHKNKEDFEEVLFIRAFKQAAKGLDGPIRYPRVKPQPDPEGENYKWFTKNESKDKRSLPPLWNETGLPYGE
ncbi:TIGR03986 family CRISPR-associated RAMP protein [Leptolyngbya sp. O-77]|uniref:TIGR03986 family type III CRISPR-associated RAMP protein n=1 Tax=Leptolyngbya sp. O-77 TaxID=1080068 RepID=UPI00074D4031|nr:TIGR03986 family CRISPR-associated RAMP protein [Leptolyngbya sp. O-77]BAU44940.1 RAMP superfamily protein [Leptolyngbya sp. O-77]